MFQKLEKCFAQFTVVISGKTEREINDALQGYVSDFRTCTWFVFLAESVKVIA